MALHSVEGPNVPGGDEDVDVDGEAGFFEMSPAGAEQVTLQIRSMMERAWGVHRDRLPGPRPHRPRLQELGRVR